MVAIENYVPVLKTKMAERQAISAIPPDRRVFTPLFEFHNVEDLDPQRLEVKSRKRKHHGMRVIAELAEGWASDRPIMLDFPFLTGHERFLDGSIAMDRLAAQGISKGLRIIPVTRLDRNPIYISTTSRIARLSGAGVAIRVRASEMANPRSLSVDLANVLGQLGVNSGDADLILDLEEITEDRIQQAVDLTTNVLRTLPGLHLWRSVVMVGSGWPMDLRDFGPNTDGVVERTEWTVWGQIASNSNGQYLVPVFGDYAIANPNPNDRITVPNIPVALRYTNRDEWVVIKKQTIQQAGAGQFIDLCAEMETRIEFLGRHHCWGDGEIGRIVDGLSNPGNATKWKQIGFVHHLTFVVEQLANLHAPVTSG